MHVQYQVLYSTMLQELDSNFIGEELYCEIGKAHNWFAAALAFNGIELECSTGFVHSCTLYFEIVENIYIAP